MAEDGVNGNGTKRKTKRENSRTAGETKPAAAIHCSRSGDWLAAEELRAIALEAVHTATDVTLDLADLDHLDAATLQILLALANDRREKGLCLHLLNASPILQQWFAYAGAASYLSRKSPGQP